jgi:hypothetical protein
MASVEKTKQKQKQSGVAELLRPFRFNPSIGSLLASFGTKVTTVLAAWFISR